MMSYAERDLPDLIENIKRLEAECESWRKQFRECAVELASAERENAKLRAVVEAAKNYFTEDLDSGIDMSRKWFKSYNMVKDALAALEGK